MPTNAYISYFEAITPLGKTAEEIFLQLWNEQSGVKPYKNTLAAHFSEEQQKTWLGAVFNEKQPACELLIEHLLSKFLEKTGKNIASIPVIICSTKGDVSYLSEKNPSPLLTLAQKVQQKFALKNTPLIISNACISGIHGIIHAQRMIQANQAEEVIVIGVDAVSDFIRKGFQSLMATSDELCQPFDAQRKGLNLGEAAAILVVQKHTTPFHIINGGLSNDANHISGPSRDGSGLATAVERAIGQHRHLLSENHTFISAHGTATIYNDEMECKAFHRLSLHHFPILSYKGYFGHTLGACGVLETVMGLCSLDKGKLPISFGYQNHGVSLPLHICTEKKEQEFKNFIKTGAGFGGCNAALLIEKI